MDVLALDRPRLLIRGPALRRALISGARRVVSDRDVLNKINVFPVPDGDTGSNLAFTLGSVLAGALSHRTAGAGALMRRGRRSRTAAFIGVRVCPMAAGTAMLHCSRHMRAGPNHG